MIARDWPARLRVVGATAARFRRELRGIRSAGPATRQVRVVGSSVLLLLDETVTIVDTGSRGSLRAIRTALRRCGRSLRSVSRIVLTHYHPDHIGGLAELRQATGAPVWIHRVEAPYLLGERRFPNPLGGGLLAAAAERLGPWLMPGPIPVERVLNEGDAVPALDGLTVIHTPGHTAGSISLFQPQRRWLFAADALQVIDGRLTLPARRFSEDMAAARRSIHRIAALEPETLVLSHFPPLRDRVPERLRELADSLDCAAGPETAC